MNNVKITDIKVTLCDTRVKGNFADSTRQVETIGFAVVEVETNVGITGIGVTYHEVGGEAIREFIRHAIKPKFIGRNPFETEALYKEPSTICAAWAVRAWPSAHTVLWILLCGILRARS